MALPLYMAARLVALQLQFLPQLAHRWSASAVLRLHPCLSASPAERSSKFLGLEELILGRVVELVVALHVEALRLQVLWLPLAHGWKLVQRIPRAPRRVLKWVLRVQSFHGALPLVAVPARGLRLPFLDDDAVLWHEPGHVLDSADCEGRGGGSVRVLHEVVGVNSLARFPLAPARRPLLRRPDGGAVARVGRLPPAREENLEGLVEGREDFLLAVRPVDERARGRAPADGRPLQPRVEGQSRVPALVPVEALRVQLRERAEFVLSCVRGARGSLRRLEVLRRQVEVVAQVLEERGRLLGQEPSGVGGERGRLVGPDVDLHFLLVEDRGVLWVEEVAALDGDHLAVKRGLMSLH